MDDLVTITMLVASAFFAALSFILLFRYRQLSTRISNSNDLGKDLWGSLESRLKKQDERILDMMAKVDVIHSRAVERQAQSLDLPGPGGAAAPPSPSKASPKRPGGSAAGVTSPASRAVTPRDETEEPSEDRVPPPGKQVDGSAAILREIASLETRMRVQDERLLDIAGLLESSHAAAREAPRADASRETPRRLEPPAVREGGEKVSESDLLAMLGEKPRTSVEIRVRYGITREHAARLLKGLFDRGLVVRNDAHKPFVYELTETGKQASAGP